MPKSIYEKTPSVTTKYIVIEGPIGVGKSSLAKRLASNFGSSLLLEKPIENPFLERFYHSPEQFAFHTQLYFLFQRVELLKGLNRETNMMQGCIADFMMEKDPLFAELNLNIDEYQLYQKVYQMIELNKPTPDLVIYLQAPVEELQARIDRRRVRFEMGMSYAYLQKICKSYTEYFHHYSESALLIVNASEINPIENNSHFLALIDHIKRIDSGKHFFNPLV